jgi:hypothetical protein
MAKLRFRANRFQNIGDARKRAGASRRSKPKAQTALEVI